MALEDLLSQQLGNYGLAGVLAAILWYKLGKVEAVLYQIKGSLDAKD